MSIKSDGCFGNVINIASGKAISIKEVIKIIQKIIGCGDPQFGQISSRPGENQQLYADISMAKKLLNWNPKIALKDGLEKVIKLQQN